MGPSRRQSRSRTCVGASDDGAAVGGDHDRPFDECGRRRRHRGDPGVAGGRVARERAEACLHVRGLAATDQLPWLQAEGGQRRVQLGDRRRIVEVAAHRYRYTLLLEQREGGAALRAAWVVPDLDVPAMPRVLHEYERPDVAPCGMVGKAGPGGGAGSTAGLTPPWMTSCGGRWNRLLEQPASVLSRALARLCARSRGPACALRAWLIEVGVRRR
ncbi:MAG: hypothetical protein ACJA2F_001020 [Nitriliruptoraceae bacterium]|jgi:hypothetical protein